MQVGAFTCWLGDRPLADALDFLAALNIHAVEIGTGGYPGDTHASAAELAHNTAKRAAFLQAFDARGMTISALSCMGNPLHPQEAIAAQHRQQFRDSVVLAEQLGIPQVITFAGCPGTPTETHYPNWVTTTFPEEFLELLEWQWRERVIPYWQDEMARCRAHGVRVAIELHPGTVTYNTATFMRLRAAIGEDIGVAYDPSHLFWQQMDPIAVVRALGTAIFHVHAKDTVINQHNTQRNGVVDVTPPDQPAQRSWQFRTVGYGHDAQFWKALVSALQEVGYDGALSIEAEDTLLSKREGLTRAAQLLHDAVSTEAPDAPWWT